MVGVPILPLSAILIFDFRTVPTVWYVLTFILFPLFNFHIELLTKLFLCICFTDFLIPVMVCAIIITLYVYQTDGTKTWLFSLLKIKLLNVDISFGNVSKTNINISTGNTSYSPHLSNIAKYLTTSEQAISTSGESDSNVTMTLNNSTSALIPNTTSVPTTVDVTNKKLHTKDVSILCPHFNGGLGNMMFQFASTFGIAMSKNMSVVINKGSELNKIFKLMVDVRTDTSACDKLKYRFESKACAYDETLSKFNRTRGFRLGSYLQSWKYFYEFGKELRKQYAFQDTVTKMANKSIDATLQKFNVTTRTDITLVGVHIRRGDMVNNAHGYNVATPEYLSRAVNYFTSKYKNVIFVVSSQYLLWSRKYMPKNISVEYICHEKRELDMAMLASCDHTISTVGSFGWWIGWLSGGEVTYFKWPAKEGSPLRKQYGKDFSDYFYPGWIGL